MKKWFPFLGLTLVCALIAAGASKQGVERLKVIEKFAVNVSLHKPLTEQLPHSQNIVFYTARHCQNYLQAGLVDSAACAADPSTLFYKSTTHNLRTNNGTDWQAGIMGNTTAAACTYIAVSSDATGANVSDTTVAGEITGAGGLARAVATYAHTSGGSSNQYTETKQFTVASGGPYNNVQKAGLLNGSSGGTLCFENTFTPVTLNNGDLLTVTWTITY